MKDKKYKGVSSFVDKSGQRRWRFRKYGLPTTMLYSEPGTPEFDEEYALCLGGHKAAVRGRAPSEERIKSRSPRDGFVYFACADRGPIKIGFSIDPEARIKSMATANARKVKVKASFRGTLRDEAAMHRKWADLRIKGEWFRRSVALMDDIKSIGIWQTDGKVCQNGG